MKRTFVLNLALGSLIILSLFTCACGEKQAPATANNPVVVTIESQQQFKKVVENPGRLMVFDLYADWCGPCRTLSPLLEEIAGENKKKADFYKINVDKHPQLAGLFKVNGIPYVVFLKDKTIVYALTGLYPKSAYVKVINTLSAKGDEKVASAPDGKLENGVRVIRFAANVNPRSIYVYRGETVKLQIAPKGYEYSVHLPDFDITQKSDGKEDLVITFKAKNIGVFPIFCNGNCPAGDGAMHAKIVVMQYKASGEAIFKELTAAETKKFIDTETPLILDVRTPNEFYSGHIPGAVLVPLQQLSQRLSELREHKEKEILVYCRSGNRSTVAAEILIRNGFRKIYNLRPGIRGWLGEGYQIEKQGRGLKI